jgi:hypothetical protein|tara:strand:- start:623 stop:850 length:228 start_codon:yes stop_codon:yes gene_type:complete
MKFTTPKIKDISDFQKERVCGPLNVFSLTTVSLVWGHMLGLLSPWFIPVTVCTLLIGYGSEINKEKPKTTQSLSL